MPTAYPRLSLEDIRTKVREITSLESTVLVSDEHLDNLVNEELHHLIMQGDELVQSWLNSAGTSAFTVTEDGITYRIPCWSWDNTTNFPSGMPGNIYMAGGASSATSYAPWKTPDNTQYKAGFYDLFLVYATASRVLKEQNDSSTRAEEYYKQASDIANTIIQQEFVGHNADRFTQVLPSDANYELALDFKVLVLLKTPLFFDSDYSVVLTEIDSALQTEKNELYNSYQWPFANTYGNFSPHSDIFAYGAASRLAARYSLSESEQAALRADYESRKQSLLRNYLYNNSGTQNLGTLGDIRFQVRSLLQDFTRDMPDVLLNAWINESYITLCNELEWRWLENEDVVVLPAGTNYLALSGGLRLMALYEITTDDNGDNATSSQIYPAGHTLDVLGNASRYTYSMAPAISQGSYLPANYVEIRPTPTENLTILQRFAINPAQLTQDGDYTFIPDGFASILAYRAASIGAAFHPQAKQLIPVYQSQADKMYEALRRAYQLDNSTETFSIGENALESRKYLPFFKVG